jgi:hypothetical protein
MQVLGFSQYVNSIQLAEDFIQFISNDIINESDKFEYKKIIKKIIDDLNLNVQMLLTFGVGLESMFPIIRNLVKNMKLNIDLKPETVVLMTLAAVTIAYLEEKKSIKNKKILEKDAKSMLEELKLRGVGNGIVKKLVKCLISLGNLLKILFRQKRPIINGLFDMLAYTALLVPFLNAVMFMVGKYDLNIDTLPSNFLSLGLGVTTIIAKHGINFLIDKLKDKLDLNKPEILKNINDVDDPIIKKYPHPEYIDIETDVSDKNKLIKENE